MYNFFVFSFYFRNSKYKILNFHDSKLLLYNCQWTSVYECVHKRIFQLILSVYFIRCDFVCICQRIFKRSRNRIAREHSFLNWKVKHFLFIFIYRLTFVACTYVWMSETKTTTTESSVILVRHFIKAWSLTKVIFK